ncbi:MAG TPA: cupin domain-containing protein [Gaiellaceae bacterium]|nr:cupin domain-containing protein [Gaiellaceae bacterium]
MELDVHPRLVLPGQGEVLNETEGRWTEILCDAEELVVSLFRRAGGIPGPDLHVHREHADAFYVLEGTLVVPLGPDAQPEHVAAGSLALAPPLVAHAFRMDAGAVALLNVHAPGLGFGDYLRGTNERFDQEEPPPGGGRPRTDAVLGSAVERDEPGLRVVRHADEPQLAATEVVRAPAADAPPETDDRRLGVYVLEGTLLLEAGGREHVAPAGSWLDVPAGLPHALRAHGGAGVRTLELHVPV